jgi:hypothetical protein
MEGHKCIATTSLKRIGRDRVIPERIAQYGEGKGGDRRMELSRNDISIINRALGVIEGLSYAVQDPGVADGLVGAIERIEAVINRGEEDGK